MISRIIDLAIAGRCRLRSALRLATSVHCLLFTGFGAFASAQTNTFPSTGNVGIGTTSPAQKLDVVATSNDGYQGLVIRPANQSQNLALGWNGISGTYHLQMGSGSSQPIQFLVNGSERMRIEATGTVGIGTNSPVSLLDVSDGTRHTYFSPRATSVGGLEAGTDIASWGHTLNLAGDISGGGTGGGVNIAFYYGSWARALSVKNSTSLSGGKLLLMPDGGNVGIGTISPSHKLAVNGTIRAKEVIVDTGWADYVFTADYRLAPLAEVEAHIREKGHLPGIPSAAEVATEGVSLGDMQRLLLEKIEELTLHQIAQEKSLREQADSLRAQADRVATLERQNAELRQQIAASHLPY